MPLNQITDYVVIAGMIVVALATGVSTALDFYIKRAKELHKPVPQQLMTIDEIAKFVVAEAATLDISGAEKKVKATQDLIDQAKAEGKNITTSVAKGAVQQAYDERKQYQAATTDEGKENETVQPIGFVSQDDQGDDAHEG